MLENITYHTIRTKAATAVIFGIGVLLVASQPYRPQYCTTSARRRGRALIIDPQPADIQDRDGAVPILRVSRKSYLFVEKVFADMGFSSEWPHNASLIDVEIVREPPDQIGFAAHPRRWVVERFFAWISRNRRL